MLTKWRWSNSGESGGSQSLASQVVRSSRLVVGWRSHRVAVLCSAVIVSFAILPGFVATNSAPAAYMIWGGNFAGSLGYGGVNGPEFCHEGKPCAMTPIAVAGLSGSISAFGGPAVVMSNGTVMDWGTNLYGLLGNGTKEETVDATLPVKVSGISEAVAVASEGGNTRYALMANGTVKAWGSNELGQLGDGKIGLENDSNIPVTVLELSEVKQVVGGNQEGFALLKNGTVKAWGNTYGTTPKTLAGLSEVTALAAGGEFNMALLQNGTVLTWGRNELGELGDGTHVAKSGFVTVKELSGVAAIAAGDEDGFALTKSGTVMAWGANYYGQLGAGISNGPEECYLIPPKQSYCSTSPVAVSGLSGVTAIAPETALLANGTVMDWGDNRDGSLGDGTFTGPEECAVGTEGGKVACSKVPVPVDGVTAQAIGPQRAIGSFTAPNPHREELLSNANEGEPHYARSCTGKPVNCATGNESSSQTDLSVPGRGIPLTFTRTYNSLAAVNQKSAGSFGYGWSGSFGAHLVASPTEKQIEVVQANGSAVVFSGTPGTVGEFTAPAWAQAKLSLNSEHIYVYTLPSREVLKFNEQGELLSEADRNGNTTSLSYTEAGLLEAVTDPAGRKLTFAYNAEGLVESIKDPMGHTVKYAYEHGNLVSVTEPGEASPRWRYEYDSLHRLTKITDGRGGTTTNEYDGSNRVISQTDPASRTLTFEYGSLETKITNHATGAVTKEIFSEGGEPEAITRGYGTANATTEYETYNQAGEVVTVTDGNGHMTTYHYDLEGNRTLMLDAEGHETTWTYDTSHDVLTMTAPNGETTTTKRDSNGNPEAVERPAPGGATQDTTYKYNSNGELESTTNPLGHTWKYEYDNQGDKIAEIDPDGNKRTWEYNEDSQEITTVSPRGNVEGAERAKFTTKTERDQQGRAVKITDPLGHETKYGYDADGNLESVTDPLGHKTKYTYDADNELTKIEAPNGSITETGYDGAGQINSQTDGNKHTTKYTRNVLEQVTEVTDPLGHKWTREYDADGNLTKVTDPSKRTTTYVYSPTRRLKEVTYSEGTTHSVQYEYNAEGNRTKMVDGTGTSTFVYDQLGRMTESKDGHGNVVKYEYDLANELTKITYPNGKAVVRAFDQDGRLHTVKDWLEHTTTFSYNPDSSQTSTLWPSGTSGEDKYGYNEADQLSEVKMNKGTEALASLTYTRNADGLLTATTSKGLPGGESLSYEYDANSRLTKGAGVSYEYDAANNPTKLGTTTNTFNAADQLTEATGVKYTYNEIGERTKATPTSGAATTYGYDQAGNLTSLTRPKESKKAEVKDTYAYNGDGLRSSETISGTTHYFAWQTNEGMPLLLNDGTNSYIYGPEGQPIEQVSSTGVPQYLHHDQTDSTRLLTNEKGETGGKCSYSSYGTPTCEGTSTTPLGYNGQFTSADTGLIYLRAREYDPGTAEFFSVDPQEIVTGEPYNYAGDNPLEYADPSGDGLVSFVESAAATLACGFGGPEACASEQLAVTDLRVISNDVNAILNPCQAIEDREKSIADVLGGAATVAGSVVLPSAEGTIPSEARSLLEKTLAGRNALRLLGGLNGATSSLIGSAVTEQVTPGKSNNCGCERG